MFRANRTKSIRAPAITELFLPSAQVFSFANDPCDENFIAQGTAPATRAKNCAAAGIPTGFVSNVVNATALGTTSGNPDLHSEIADSRTIGVVLQPRWVPKLNIQFDLIDIKLAQAIESLSLVQVLDACYDSPDYPNNPSCQAFTRNPTTHQVTGFHVGYVNAGLLEFRGLTSSIDYSYNLPQNLGGMEWRINYLDTKELMSQVGSASPNDLSGELANAPGIPKTKGSIDAKYLKGPFSWDWQAEYLGRINFNNQNTATTQDYFGVGAWWLINSTLAYSPSKNFTVRLIVDNVFNKQPPFPALAGAQANFTPATTLYFSGIVGRAYVVSANYHF
jgi:outer membrane receptor protein involved in Fe transport